MLLIGALLKVKSAISIYVLEPLLLLKVEILKIVFHFVSSTISILKFVDLKKDQNSEMTKRYEYI